MLKPNLLVKYETPEGRRGTLRIPTEWSDNVEKLFYPNKVVEALYIGDYTDLYVEQLIKVYLRDGR